MHSSSEMNTESFTRRVRCSLDRTNWWVDIAQLVCNPDHNDINLSVFSLCTGYCFLINPLSMWDYSILFLFHDSFATVECYEPSLPLTTYIYLLQFLFLFCTDLLYRKSFFFFKNSGERNYFHFFLDVRDKIRSVLCTICVQDDVEVRQPHYPKLHTLLDTNWPG